MNCSSAKHSLRELLVTSTSPSLSNRLYLLWYSSSMCRTLTLPAAGSPSPVTGIPKLNPMSENFTPNLVTLEELPSSLQLSTSSVPITQYIYCSSYAPPALLPLPPSTPPPGDIKLSSCYYYYCHSFYYYYFYSSHFPVYFPWYCTSPFINNKLPVYYYFLFDGHIPSGEYAEAPVDPCKGGSVITEMAVEEEENGGNVNNGKSSVSRFESCLEYSIDEEFPNGRRMLRKSTRHYVNNPYRRNIVSSKRGRHSSKAKRKLEWKSKIDCFPFGDCTTLMIRNIPNRLSRRELLELLDAHCQEENKKTENCSESTRSEFDFVYLPVDFERKSNYGFAFVNFTNVEGAFRFLKSWNRRDWVQYGYNSKKICKISCAHIQGKQELKKRFERSVFACNTDEYLPVELSPPTSGGSHAEVVTVGRCRGA